LFASSPSAQVGGPGNVIGERLIDGDAPGGADVSSLSVAGLGDLDADGIVDFAALHGSVSDVVLVVRLSGNGSAKSSVYFGIGGSGGFGGTIRATDRFGHAMGRLDDFDLDGVPDMLVGAYEDNDGGKLRGAAWLVFLNPDGTVKDERKISSTQGGFTGPIRTYDRFGWSLCKLDDMDGDGVPEIAVGSPGADPGAYQFDDLGAVWILFLNPDGTVKSQVKVTHGQGGFTGVLAVGDELGTAVAPLGDLDGDGVGDLAVGASQQKGLGGNREGAVWILFLNADGTVKAHQKIAEGVGGFPAPLEDDDLFGCSISDLGDLDGDGVTDISVGAKGDLDGDLGNGNGGQGATWILFLKPDGMVKDVQKISVEQGYFDGALSSEGGSAFGRSQSPLGDLDGAGGPELLVGSLVNAVFPIAAAHAQWIVHLDNGTVAATYPFGDTVNSSKSLTDLSGSPRIGMGVDVGIDNPLGTQSPGSLPYHFLSLAPDPAFPAGTLLPDFGMAGPGAAGELLIGLGAGDLVSILAGPPWTGPGVPSSITLDVPNDPSLQGLYVYGQGLLFDPSAAQGVKFGLTGGLQFRLGL
jgi:hypothetical protein